MIVSHKNKNHLQIYFVSYAADDFCKHCDKWRNCSCWAISPFVTMFSSKSIIYVHLKRFAVFLPWCFQSWLLHICGKWDRVNKLIFIPQNNILLCFKTIDQMHFFKAFCVQVSEVEKLKYICNIGKTHLRWKIFWVKNKCSLFKDVFKCFIGKDSKVVCNMERKYD